MLIDALTAGGPCARVEGAASRSGSPSASRAVGVPRRVYRLGPRPDSYTKWRGRGFHAAPRSHHRRRQRGRRRLPARARRRRRARRPACRATDPRPGAAGAAASRSPWPLAAMALPFELSALSPLLSWAYQDGAPGILFASVRVLACLLMVLVPAIALGATFPLAIRAVAAESNAPARRTAMLYAANTAGAAAGALLAGFVLIPGLGLRRHDRRRRRGQPGLGNRGWPAGPAPGPHTAGPCRRGRRTPRLEAGPTSSRVDGWPSRRALTRDSLPWPPRSSGCRASPRSSTNWRGRASWRWSWGRPPTPSRRR